MDKRKIIGIVASVICVLCVIWLVVYRVQTGRQEDLYENLLPSSVEFTPEPTEKPAATEQPKEESNTPEPSATPVPTEEPKQQNVAGLEGYEIPEKELDFEKLQTKTNKDIYSWIVIPGTKVDYPILQHPTKLDYYLEYNIDGSKGYPGCIYTQNLNKTDWTDHNTVIYGHNMKNGTMFANLHKYEDSKFFEEHPYIYIFTPDDVLVYQIFAAYEFTDDHLLFVYDTESEVGFQKYLDGIRKNVGFNNNYNNDIELTAEDYIITLSTCIQNKPKNRYLVQGVLVAKGER